MIKKNKIFKLLLVCVFVLGSVTSVFADSTENDSLAPVLPENNISTSSEINKEMINFMEEYNVQPLNPQKVDTTKLIKFDSIEEAEAYLQQLHETLKEISDTPVVIDESTDKTLMQPKFALNAASSSIKTKVYKNEQAINKITNLKILTTYKYNPSTSTITSINKVTSSLTGVTALLSYTQDSYTSEIIKAPKGKVYCGMSVNTYGTLTTGFEVNGFPMSVSDDLNMGFIVYNPFNQ